MSMGLLTKLGAFFFFGLVLGCGEWLLGWIFVVSFLVSFLGESERFQFSGWFRVRGISGGPKENHDIFPSIFSLLW